MAEDKTVTPPQPVEFVEDRIPPAGIEGAIEELVVLYGGEVTESRHNTRLFVLPLRRGVPTSGSVACTLSWTVSDSGQATVKLVCDREIDAPKTQRILMLVAGVLGSILFMLWPFFPDRKEFGTLAWLGGAVALSVYFLSLRKTSGGIAWDFLQRLAATQRSRELL
jgi:hypothetical protein